MAHVSGEMDMLLFGFLLGVKSISLRRSVSLFQGANLCLCVRGRSLQNSPFGIEIGREAVIAPDAETELR